MLEITILQAVSITTKFLFTILSKNTCKKLIRADLQAAQNILDKLDQEGNTDLGLTRALTHLESAYYKMKEKYSGGVYNNLIQLEIMNTICFHIAYIHKSLGADSELINDWIINKTNYKGGYDGYPYAALLDNSFSEFEKSV